MLLSSGHNSAKRWTIQSCIFCLAMLVAQSFNSQSFNLSIPTASAATFGITRPGNMLGLVGWWTFDGKNLQQNATDSSGQGSNGYLRNFTSTSTSVVSGKIGQALNFDGISNYVLMGSPTSLNITTNAVTMCAWVYSTLGTTGSYQGLMAKRTGVSYDYGINFITNNFQIYTSGTSGVQGFVYNLPAKKWTFLCGEISSAPTAFYVNGSLFGTAGAGGGIQQNSGNVFSVGQSGDTNENFNGIIDDVRVYNRVLSAQEISRLYVQGSAKFATSKAGSAGLLSSGLLSYLTFDGKDMANGVAQDKSGNGNKGNLISIATSTAYVLGKIGQGLALDGAASYADLGSFADNLPNFTVAIWFKTNNDYFSGAGAIIAKTGSGGYTSGNGWGMFMTPNASDSGVNHLFAQIQSGAGAQFVGKYTSGAINDGKWHHAAMVVTNANTLTLYIDGVATGVTDNVGTIGSYTNTAPVRIGNDVDSQFFNGSVDDARVYGRALSAKEIQQLYDEGVATKMSVSQNVGNTSCASGLSCGLVGYWTFDGKDMSNGVALDQSGQGNNGNLINIATSTFYAAGKMGQAFHLTGNGLTTGQSVKGSSSPFGFSDTTFTVSAWTKIINDGQEQEVIAQGGGPNTYNNGWTVFESSGNPASLNVAFRNGSVVFNAGSNTSPLTNNVWHHVVAVITTNTSSAAGNNAVLYVDGIQLAATLTKTAAYVPETVGPWSIGARDGGGWGLMNGYIDDVRVYNRALSTQEIGQLYNQGK